MESHFAESATHDYIRNVINGILPAWHRENSKLNSDARRAYSTGSHEQLHPGNDGRNKL